MKVAFMMYFKAKTPGDAKIKPLNGRACSCTALSSMAKSSVRLATPQNGTTTVLVKRKKKLTNIRVRSQSETLTVRSHAAIAVIVAGTMTEFMKSRTRVGT